MKVTDYKSKLTDTLHQQGSKSQTIDNADDPKKTTVRHEAGDDTENNEGEKKQNQDENERREKQKPQSWDWGAPKKVWLQVY